MNSQYVLGGRFRVFEDGRINKCFDNIDTPAKTYATGRRRKYLTVRWYENGKPKSAYVHRLIAAAFVENPDNLPQVNHKDGNTFNNRADNLEWVSPGDNVRHAYKSGLINRMAYGEPCERCGDFTLSKDKLCTRCKQIIMSEEAQERVLEERIIRYKSVNLDLCSAAERNYVSLAASGMSIPSIAEIYGVSKQCVGAALLNAEKKTVVGVSIPKTVQNERVRLQNNVTRKLKKLEEAKAKVASLQLDYETAVSNQEKYEKMIHEQYPGWSGES